MNERDSELHAQWRKHSAQSPPAALDDAIRAAAHRAVKSKPTSMKARAPWPAWATFAAAASIGAIAIGVWQMQPREFDETAMVTSDVPARAAKPATIAPPTAGPVVKDQVPVAPAVRAQPPAMRAQQQPADAAADSATRAPHSAVPDRDIETLGSRFRGNDGEKQDVAAAKARDSTAADARESAAPIRRPAPAAFPTDAAGGSTTRAMQSPAATRDKTQQEADMARAPARAPSPFPAGGARQRDAGTTFAPRPDAESAAGKLAAPSASSENSSGARKTTAPTPATDAAPATPPPALMKQRAEAQRSLRAAAPDAKVRNVNDFIDAIRRALTEHRDADAARLLTDMRAQYVDADSRLPADLRAWAGRAAPPTH
ncbi:MAG: hypothetical protein ABI552_13935 [Casimicrobiaceae bacterium]